MQNFSLYCIVFPTYLGDILDELIIMLSVAYHESR